MALKQVKKFEYSDTHMSYFLAATALNIILFMINLYLMQHYFPVTKKFSRSQRLDFSIRLVTLLDMVVVCSMSLYVYVFETELESDPIWYDSPVLRRCSAILLGHLVTDSLICTIFYKELGDNPILCHHMVAICAYFHSVAFGTLPYFTNLRSLGEFSTPYTLMRFLLDILGYRSSHPTYIVNGILMTLSFFFCRIMAIPVCWQKIYSVFGTSDFMLLGNWQYVFIVFSAIADFLNCYWFFLICRGLFKVLRNLRTKPHSS